MATLTSSDISHNLSEKATDIPVNRQMGVAFRDLSYSVPIRSKKGKAHTKTILHSVTGLLRPGRFTVILGSSGAGKTSLLNLLSGEARTGSMSGQILINGQEVTGSEVNELSGFVQQDDVILDTMTVKEAITMSALLRIPPTVSIANKHERVADVIDLMQLEKAADTMIGNPESKGVSGGERKRTCISMELVTNPSILFLDEPTSGLDTYTAFSVCNSLKKLAHSGRTIVATLHQPSSEIFHLIDDLILMADGKIMYAGAANRAVQYFSGIGYPCPQYVNPADFIFMSVLHQSGDSSSDAGTLDVDSFSDVSSTADGSVSQLERGENTPNRRPRKTSAKDSLAIQLLLQNWQSSDLSKVIDAEARSSMAGGAVHGYDESLRKYHSGFLTQFSILMKRSWANVWRNPMIVRVKVIQALFLAFFIDAIFWKVNNRGDDAQIQDRAGVIFFFVVNQIFNYSMGNLMIFYKERLVFEREYSGGMYSLPAYFTSKALIEIPFVVVIPFFLVCITYFAVGLQADAGKFFIFAVTTVILANVGAALGLCAASSFRNVEIALAFVPMILLPLMIFSGLFVNLDGVHAWIRWVQWISPMKYGYIAMCINEFDGLTIGGKSSDQIISQLGLAGKGSLAVNIVALLCFCILLWAISYLGLRRLVASSRKSISVKKNK